MRLLLFLLLAWGYIAGQEPKPAPALMLYYSRHCPYSYKVLSYLDKIGKSVPMKDVSKDRSAKEELLEIGGKPQVPCLVIDGRPLYESDAIIDWLSTHQNILLPKKEGYDILTRHGNRQVQTAQGP